jgi:hypothetical protein
LTDILHPPLPPPALTPTGRLLHGDGQVLGHRELSQMDAVDAEGQAKMGVTYMAALFSDNDQLSVSLGRRKRLFPPSLSPRHSMTGSAGLSSVMEEAALTTCVWTASGRCCTALRRVNKPGSAYYPGRLDNLPRCRHQSATLVSCGDCAGGDRYWQQVPHGAMNLGWLHDARRVH